MTDRFKNIYRIESARMSNWDYAWSASYFITICTKDKECFFGNINNGKIHLSDIGTIVRSEWLNTLELRPDMNLKLDEYVVMPNHFHGIIAIGRNQFNSKDLYSSDIIDRDTIHNVPPSRNQFGPQVKNLPSIIRGFKSAVTKQSRLINPEFKWQPRYHDHVIRDEQTYLKIKNYIRTNPLNWTEDIFHV